ncbi:M23 family metallopeptidase [Streptomyces sp. B6B3]|uniref:M23 family metallopeptidase n=1 Tax=Streptomyces sp. B6B3 TaxID=3153570 RepID=UPI00325EAF6B
MASNRYAALADTYADPRDIAHDDPYAHAYGTPAYYPQQAPESPAMTAEFAGLGPNLADTSFGGDAGLTPPFGEHGLRHAEYPEYSQPTYPGGPQGVAPISPISPITPVHPAAPAEAFAAAEDYGPVEAFGPVGPDGPGAGDTGEWNPSEDSIRPLRGRHRVARQRGGTMARSRAVLGVGVIAAVGAGGMATAHEDGAGSVPGLDGAADKVRSIPQSLPLIGDLVPGGAEDGSESGTSDSVTEMVAQAPFTTAGITEADMEAGRSDAGEALRARILQQADQQETNAADEALRTALAEAEASAADEAAAQAEAEREAAEQERREREEAERLAELRASYTLPLSDYSLSSYFGESGSLWAADHTGQDFSAPTGTPVKNVHTGVIAEAAWAGSYGYRIIVELEDGTEVWYCHLSSMNVGVGQEVTTGDTIGLVGSTGNSTGPHLHLEVRPGGGDPVDPLAWLRDKGLTV